MRGYDEDDDRRLATRPVSLVETMRIAMSSESVCDVVVRSLTGCLADRRSSDSRHAFGSDVADPSCASRSYIAINAGVPVGRKYRSTSAKLRVYSFVSPAPQQMRARASCKRPCMSG